MTAQGGYGDYKGEALNYGQYEARNADHTTGNWHTQLPGKSHIKFDYDVNAQVVQVVKAAAPAYAAPAYKAPEYKPAY